MRYLILTASVLAIGLAAPALAQPASATNGEVTVAIGPALQQKARDFGPRELAEISNDLRSEVKSAIAHSKTVRPVQVDLVIEDAVPNRPTFAQLGRNVSLSAFSVGVGGARISGMATYADGSQRPIREQFFETDIRDERGATTWYDAERAFQQLAYDVGRGKFRSSYVGPGPSGSGHFGYPFFDQ